MGNNVHETGVSLPIAFNTSINSDVFSAFYHRQGTGQYEKLNREMGKLDHCALFNIGLDGRQNRYQFAINQSLYEPSCAFRAIYSNSQCQPSSNAQFLSVYLSVFLSLYIALGSKYQQHKHFIFVLDI